MSDCSNWRGDRIKAAVERQFRERDRVKTGRTSCQRETVGMNAESDRGDERES